MVMNYAALVLFKAFKNIREDYDSYNVFVQRYSDMSSSDSVYRSIFIEMYRN